MYASGRLFGMATQTLEFTPYADSEDEEAPQLWGRLTSLSSKYKTCDLHHSSCNSYSLGRTESNDFVFPEKGKHISSKHCVISYSTKDNSVKVKSAVL